MGGQRCRAEANHQHHHQVVQKADLARVVHVDVVPDQGFDRVVRVGVGGEVVTDDRRMMIICNLWRPAARQRPLTEAASARGLLFVVLQL